MLLDHGRNGKSCHENFFFQTCSYQLHANVISFAFDRIDFHHIKLIHLCQALDIIVDPSCHFYRDKVFWLRVNSIRLRNNRLLMIRYWKQILALKRVEVPSYYGIHEFPIRLTLTFRYDGIYLMI